jgi:general secretion pathway protein L
MATWLGIDIGSSAVKVALVRSAYRKTTLEAVARVDFDEGSDVRATVRAAVAAVLGGTPSGNDGVGVAIDGSRAAVRTLELPAGAQKQLAEVLPFELEAQLPIEMSDAVFDFRVVGTTSGPDPASAPVVTVLVAVARIEDVRARIDVVKDALGTEPERVGVGALPLANLAPYVPALADDGPVVVVDLGASASDFVVLRRGDPVFARTLSFGTRGLPQTASRLAREIRVSVAAYRATGGAMPTHVFLCGGGAFVSGAAGFLAHELELPAEAVEALPLPTLELGPGVSAQSVAELPRYAKAIGLSLGLSTRSLALDLRRGPLAYERGFAWVREKIPILAGLGAVIVVSFFFSAWAQMHATSGQRESLEKALGAVTKEELGEEATSASRANELLGQLTAINDEDPMPHADAFDVMVKLSEDIPESITHDVEDLDVQKGHVIIHGIVGSVTDAESISGALGQEKCFGDVKITRINQVVGAEPPRQKYVLEFDEKCPEDIRGGKKKDSQAQASASSSAGGGK